MSRSFPVCQFAPTSPHDPNDKPSLLHYRITSGTIPHDASSYVVRQADADLLDGLRAGEFCYILTTRQMGKSSLMVRAAALRAERNGVAFLYLTAVGLNVSARQSYRGLLTMLLPQVTRAIADKTERAELSRQVAALLEENAIQGDAQRFFAALEELVLPRLPADASLVVFVDTPARGRGRRAVLQRPRQVAKEGSVLVRAVWGRYARPCQPEPEVPRYARGRDLGQCAALPA